MDFPLNGKGFHYFCHFRLCGILLFFTKVVFVFEYRAIVIICLTFHTVTPQLQILKVMMKEFQGLLSIQVVDF